MMPRRKMTLLLFVVLWGFLVTTPQGKSCSRSSKSQDEAQEYHQAINESTSIHLRLHHVNGPDCFHLAPQLLLSDLLAKDEARVGALNSRISRSNSSSSSSTSSVSVPLKPGTFIGTSNYYVRVGLGTPPQFYPVLVDTGSSFNWVQCRPCVVYCHPQLGSVFDPLASKTYKKLPCGAPECSALEDATLNVPSCSKAKVCVYEASYGDSSFSIGYLSRDALTLGAGAGAQLPGFVYGCGQDNQGYFGRSAGLIGLARNKLSMLAQLSSKFGYAFSYCLPSASTAGTGSLSIGASSFNPALFRFTPMLTAPLDSSLYFLRLAAITVAGKPLTAVSPAQYGGPTIIDSGTVITRLAAPVYAALRDAFVKAMGSRFQRLPPYSILDTCFRGGMAVAVPEVRLVFQGGADLKLGPPNVALEVEKGVACLAFAATGGLSIIGNRQQQTFTVAYDVANSRIGFAAGGCR